MSDVDVAKLKRLRGAVTAALERVPKDSAHGLPPTYASLRDQVMSAIPNGLRAEAEAIAPALHVRTGARGPHDIIAASKDGAVVRAHLAALEGWLNALIDSE